ncbi:MAG: hypothetical protein EXR43_05005 [Dehalococcoidia bacterium]|nr:hypothetical protein [Dehalococcoidia bacterium]
MKAGGPGGTPSLLALAPPLALISAGRNSSAPSGQPPVATPISPSDIRALIASEIRVPTGFTAYRFAEGIQRPTALTLALDGGVWLAEEGGDVYELRNPGDHYRAEPRRCAAALGLAVLLGIAFDERGTLFASSRGGISAVEDTNRDGTADRVRNILTGLLTGDHQNNNLVVGRDGRLYFGLGTSCSVCDGRILDARSATIMSVRPEGGEPIVFATGLRNAHGVAFAAVGNLYATDNGADPPDVRNSPYELNRIVYEGRYRWPRCAGARETGPGGCVETGLSVGALQPYISSGGIVIYNPSTFPERYHHVAFIAQRGNSGDSTVGRRVATVAVREEQPVEQVFATGFEHPLAVVMDRNGVLLVADWGRGIVYAIVHEGAR